MKNTKLRMIVQASLFAALICVATMVVHIPVPATGGYLNLGDAFVLLSGLLLGPVYGFAAGGIGSMLADLLSGYSQYAIGTFIVKGASALIAALLWRVLKTRPGFKPGFSAFFASLIAELFMAAGYFVYEAFLLGYGLAAAAAIPGNLLQACAGILLAIPLFLQLRHTHFLP